MDHETSEHPKFNRRKFLVGGVVAGLTAFGVLKSVEHFQQNESSIQKVREFEEKIGNSTLSFEEAKTYIPMLTDLYRNTYPTLRSSEDFQNSIYILRHRSLPAELNDKIVTIGDERYQSAMAYDFINNYPDYKVSGPEFSSIFGRMHMFSSLIGQTTENNNIFLLLDRVNNPNLDVRPEWKRPTIMYIGKGEDATKTAHRPVTYFRSLVHHEMAHADENARSKSSEKLDPELFSSFQRINDLENEKLEEPGQAGFVFGFQKENVQTRRDLEELLADYFMFKIAIDNALPYFGGHGHTPIDAQNFENVLRQSGISDKEMYSMHQKGEVNEFMLKFAKGAKNIDLPTRETQLDFAMKTFFFAEPENIWNVLKPHFDNIKIEQKEVSSHLATDKCCSLEL